MKPIGVLALQGDFDAHRAALREVGLESLEVRWPAQLAEVSGLVIPGGESTTLIKLIREAGLVEPLLGFGHSGAALYGTCAGAILLAARVTNPEQFCLGLIDIEIERNAYGRQRESFETVADAVVSDELTGAGPHGMELVFIRAPRIRSVGPGVKTLVTHAGDPVLVRRDGILAGTFHPELGRDRRVHAYFAEMCRGAPVAV